MDLTIGVLGFVAVLVLGILRVPVAVAMAVVGLAGGAALGGLDGILYLSGTLPYDAVSPYGLSVVPLFVMMGVFAGRAGLSRALYDVADLLVGRFRGGLAMATIGASAGFGAICGSSLATCATIGKVALPEMRRHGYHDGLATGVLAAGGTLGILIPPSVVLVIYAVLTGQNIDRMFIAALVPGVLAALGYMAAIRVQVMLNPDAAPAVPRISWSERLRGLARTWPVFVIFVTVIGGIYAGVFTPTEGAAVGAAATGLFALVRGGLRRGAFTEVVMETASGTAMIFMIVLGAAAFNGFLALTGLPMQAAETIGGLDVPPIVVLAAILALYLALGCIMDSLSMILLTVPIFYPLIMALDFGLPPAEAAIWFGILALVVVEVGMITPPVGLNVFVINAMSGGTPMRDTFAGVIPFLVSDVLRILALVAFPGITLGLMRLLY